eukprot:126524-Chlamydomonas_euryale.AAC.4
MLCRDPHGVGAAANAAASGAGSNVIGVSVAGRRGSRGRIPPMRRGFAAVWWALCGAPWCGLT